MIALYFLSSAAGLVLSSTSLYLDSCLYARNTIKAIIRKSIIFDIKSPYLNSVVEPARLVTLKVIVSRVTYPILSIYELQVKEATFIDLLLLITLLQENDPSAVDRYLQKYSFAMRNIVKLL